MGFWQDALHWVRKNSQLVIPKGGDCPRNPLSLGSREEKQIPRFARDDKKYFFGSLFSLSGFTFLMWQKADRLKPVLPELRVVNGCEWVHGWADPGATKRGRGR
jgi:hypothetical protein